MDKNRTVLKTFAWVSGAVISFAAAFLAGGMLLDKLDQKQWEKGNREGRNTETFSHSDNLPQYP